MLELMIHLDSDSEKPLYEQIYDYIRSHIADGKISRGEKLPSTRLLSGYLQVSRSTVELAYEQLLSEGYIESKPSRGYYAGDISDLYLSGQAERKKENQTGKGTFVTSTVSDRQPLCRYRIDFSSDENDYHYFPYNAWRRISKELLSADDPSLFRAGEAAGEWELREAVCQYLYHARGVNCSPGQIIIGAGNEYLLMLLAQVLGSRKKVAIENPTYLKAYATLFHMNYEMLLSGMDNIDNIRIACPNIFHSNPAFIHSRQKHFI